MLIKNNLEHLLQAHWTEFLDKNLLIKNCLEYCRNFCINGNYKILKQEKIPPLQLKLSITNILLAENALELWVEFSIPYENDVVIGTLIMELNLNGKIKIKQSYGTRFVLNDIQDANRDAVII